MGIGDWGLGIGDWGLGPIPNPQSPIPNPQSPFIELNLTSLIYIFIFEIKSFIIFFNKIKNEFVSVSFFQNNFYFIIKK